MEMNTIMEHENGECAPLSPLNKYPQPVFGEQFPTVAGTRGEEREFIMPTLYPTSSAQTKYPFSALSESPYPPFEIIPPANTYYLETGAPSELPHRTYAYLHDDNKNVMGLADSRGELACAYQYDAYGRCRQVGAGNADNPLCWSSEYYDDTLGLVFYNYRCYNPLDGRWLSREPLEERGSFNLYRAFVNAPTNNRDILGLWNDGLGGLPGYKGDRGHSDFPGHDIFDYTKEDSDWLTSPFNPASTARHFRTLEESEKDLSEAVCKCSKEEFERAAHRMQDFFSHRGQGFKANLGRTGKNSDFGHAGTSMLADRIWNEGRYYPRPDNALDYEKAFKAASDRTQMWLGNWNRFCCKDSTGKWRKKEGERCNPKGIYPGNDFGGIAPPPRLVSKEEDEKERAEGKARREAYEGFPQYFKSMQDAAHRSADFSFSIL